MRTQIVAGNWKMNNNLKETKTFLENLKTETLNPKTQVMVSPPFTSLSLATEALNTSPIEVIAQNMHFENSGAYTGEISSGMLKSIGVRRVILGHSERRAYFGETDAILLKKVDAAIREEMNIIFCFGEELEHRKNGKHFDVVASQLKSSLCHLETAMWQQIILAYEPIWAIGTGETATSDQAQEMHAFVRKTISELSNNKVSDSVSILYGGSVKPDNARDIFSQSDVDGGLIGGASLHVKDFVEIVNSI